MANRALVIGGQGFIGFNVVMSLFNDGWNVKVLDRNINSKFNELSVKTIVGHVQDKDTLRLALRDVDVVFYFISHSLPSSSRGNLNYELQNSLIALDNVLETMVDLNVKKIVFPSSGGTVYGNVEDQNATESTELNPFSSYGQGKLLSEEIIKFYSRVHNIEYLILRISNIYGCQFYRKVEQGAVDIFIQNILDNKPITIWSGAENAIRDYIFIDDFCDALIALLNRRKYGIYNIGTGEGKKLTDIIEVIEKILKKEAIIVRNNNYSGISKNVLDISKIIKDCAWQPKFSLEEGITKTIKRKKENYNEISRIY
ncbi:NAD-dependent epimerase/dehydratase family protein [Paenibacillus sp. FSL W8-0187]|uniref:NAD-dependent epimerase/dehydratase family protein n=1 Tax=Paenibacillus sp. FSL W8-0187 TaxID=2921710 RepID=UPI0030DC7A58